MFTPEIRCTDFKSSKKSLDFEDFFRIFLDFCGGCTRILFFSEQPLEIRLNMQIDAR